MKNSARVLTRRIRRRVLEDVGLLKRLGKLFRRLARELPAWGRLCVLLWIAVFGGSWLTFGGGWKLLLLFTSVLSIVRIQVGTFSFYSPEAAELSVFPIGDDEIFRRVWLGRQRRILLWIAVTSIWFAFALGGATKWQAGPADWLVVPLAATAHEILLVSLATIWSAYFPQVRLKSYVGTTLSFSLAVMLFAARTLGPVLAPSMQWLLLLLPTGWVAGALLAWQTNTTIPVDVYRIACVAAIAWLPKAYQKLRREYEIREISFQAAQGMCALGPDDVREEVPVEIGDAHELRQQDGHPPQDGPPWQTDSARRHGVPRQRDLEGERFFVRFALRRQATFETEGRLERLVLERMSARERAIASLFLDRSSLVPFARKPPASWGRQWIKGVQWLAILLILVCALPLPAVWRWVAFLPVAFVTLTRTPLLGGIWPGVQFLGTSLSLTTLPISYWDSARVILRFNRFRILLWVPLVIAGCAVAGWKSGFGVDVGMILGAKASYVAMVLQPLWFMMIVNQNSDDRSRVLLGLTAVVVCLMLVAAMIASGIALFLPDSQWNLAGAIGLPLATYLLFWLDRARYEFGGLDVVKKPAVSAYSSG